MEHTGHFQVMLVMGDVECCLGRSFAPSTRAEVAAGDTATARWKGGFKARWGWLGHSYSPTGALWEHSIPLCLAVGWYWALPFPSCGRHPWLGRTAREGGGRGGLALENPPHLLGNAIKLALIRPIWAPARQGCLVGPASLTTHRPGHIIRACLWPSSQRGTPRL